MWGWGVKLEWGGGGVKRKTEGNYERDIRKGETSPVPYGLCSITSWFFTVISVSSTQAEVQVHSPQYM